MAPGHDTELGEQLRLARELQASYGKPAAPSVRGKPAAPSGRGKPRRPHRGRNEDRANSAGPSRGGNGRGQENSSRGRPSLKATKYGDGKVVFHRSDKRPVGNMERNVVPGSSTDLLPGTTNGPSPAGRTTFRLNLRPDMFPGSANGPSSAVGNMQRDIVTGSLTDNLSGSANQSSSAADNGQQDIAVNFRGLTKNGLASSYWADPNEAYRAPFPYKVFVAKPGPSQAFLEGRDLIDLPTLAMVPLFRHPPETPSLAADQPAVECTRGVGAGPSANHANNENAAPARAPKPSKGKGLASSKWST